MKNGLQEKMCIKLKIMEKFVIITFIGMVILVWFWALTDIARSRFHSPRMNTIWILIVLGFPLIGSFAYLRFKKTITTSKSRSFSPKFN